MKLYRAKLKSRKRIMAEIPREQQGWWADVCPGKTLMLRDANEADVARCSINEGQSRDPADYFCEAVEHGSLVRRIAVEAQTEIADRRAAPAAAQLDAELPPQEGAVIDYGSNLDNMLLRFPELPEPKYSADDLVDIFTAEQMFAYASKHVAPYAERIRHIEAAYEAATFLAGDTINARNAEVAEQAERIRLLERELEAARQVGKHLFTAVAAAPSPQENTN